MCDKEIYGMLEDKAYQLMMDYHKYVWAGNTSYPTKINEAIKEKLIYIFETINPSPDKYIELTEKMMETLPISDWMR